MAYSSGKKMMKTSAPHLTTNDTILAFCVSCLAVQSVLMKRM
jgi:hypothetical protein